MYLSIVQKTTNRKYSILKYNLKNNKYILCSREKLYYNNAFKAVYTYKYMQALLTYRTNTLHTFVIVFVVGITRLITEHLCAKAFFSPLPSLQYIMYK